VRHLGTSHLHPLHRHSLSEHLQLIEAIMTSAICGVAMSQGLDAPGKNVFRLEDLPLELFQRIIHECILVRGNTRGMSLRLVNRK
jgi:hypothetical protein